MAHLPPPSIVTNVAFASATGEQSHYSWRSLYLREFAACAYPPPIPTDDANPIGGRAAEELLHPPHPNPSDAAARGYGFGHSDSGASSASASFADSDGCNSFAFQQRVEQFRWQQQQQRALSESRRQSLQQVMMRGVAGAEGVTSSSPSRPSSPAMVASYGASTAAGGSGRGRPTGAMGAFTDGFVAFGSNESFPSAGPFSSAGGFGPNAGDLSRGHSFSANNNNSFNIAAFGAQGGTALLGLSRRESLRRMELSSIGGRLSPSPAGLHRSPSLASVGRGSARQGGVLTVGGDGGNGPLDHLSIAWWVGSVAALRAASWPLLMDGAMMATRPNPLAAPVARPTHSGNGNDNDGSSDTAFVGALMALFGERAEAIDAAHADAFDSAFVAKRNAEVLNDENLRRIRWGKAPLRRLPASMTFTLDHLRMARDAALRLGLVRPPPREAARGDHFSSQSSPLGSDPSDLHTKASDDTGRTQAPPFFVPLPAPPSYVAAGTQLMAAAISSAPSTAAGGSEVIPRPAVLSAPQQPADPLAARRPLPADNAFAHTVALPSLPLAIEADAAEVYRQKMQRGRSAKTATQQPLPSSSSTPRLGGDPSPTDAPCSPVAMPMAVGVLSIAVAPPSSSSSAPPPDSSSARSAGSGISLRGAGSIANGGATLNVRAAVPLPTAVRRVTADEVLQRASAMRGEKQTEGKGAGGTISGSAHAAVHNGATPKGASEAAAAWAQANAFAAEHQQMVPFMLSIVDPSELRPFAASTANAEAYNNNSINTYPYPYPQGYSHDQQHNSIRQQHSSSPFGEGAVALFSAATSWREAVARRRQWALSSFLFFLVRDVAFSDAHLAALLRLVAEAARGHIHCAPSRRAAPAIAVEGRRGRARAQQQQQRLGADETQPTNTTDGDTDDDMFSSSMGRGVAAKKGDPTAHTDAESNAALCVSITASRTGAGLRALPPLGSSHQLPSAASEGGSGASVAAPSASLQLSPQCPVVLLEKCMYDIVTVLEGAAPPPPLPDDGSLSPLTPIAHPHRSRTVSALLRLVRLFTADIIHPATVSASANSPLGESAAEGLYPPPPRALAEADLNDAFALSDWLSSSSSSSSAPSSALGVGRGSASGRSVTSYAYDGSLTSAVIFAQTAEARLWALRKRQQAQLEATAAAHRRAVVEEGAQPPPPLPSPIPIPALRASLFAPPLMLIAQYARPYVAMWLRPLVGRLADLFGAVHGGSAWAMAEEKRTMAMIAEAEAEVAAASAPPNLFSPTGSGKGGAVRRSVSYSKSRGGGKGKRKGAGKRGDSPALTWLERWRIGALLGSQGGGGGGGGGDQKYIGDATDLSTAQRALLAKVRLHRRESQHSTSSSALPLHPSSSSVSPPQPPTASSSPFSPTTPRLSAEEASQALRDIKGRLEEDCRAARRVTLFYTEAQLSGDAAVTARAAEAQNAATRARLEADRQRRASTAAAYAARASSIAPRSPFAGPSLSTADLFGGAGYTGAFGGLLASAAPPSVASSGGGSSAPQTPRDGAIADADESEWLPLRDVAGEREAHIVECISRAFEVLTDAIGDPSDLLLSAAGPLAQRGPSAPSPAPPSLIATFPPPLRALLSALCSTVYAHVLSSIVPQTALADCAAAVETERARRQRAAGRRGGGGSAAAGTDGAALLGDDDLCLGDALLVDELVKSIDGAASRGPHRPAPPSSPGAAVGGGKGGGGLPLGPRGGSAGGVRARTAASNKLQRPGSGNSPSPSPSPAALQRSLEAAAAGSPLVADLKACRLARLVLFDALIIPMLRDPIAAGIAMHSTDPSCLRAGGDGAASPARHRRVARSTSGAIGQRGAGRRRPSAQRLQSPQRSPSAANLKPSAVSSNSSPPRGSTRQAAPLSEEEIAIDDHSRRNFEAFSRYLHIMVSSPGGGRRGGAVAEAVRAAAAAEEGVAQSSSTAASPSRGRGIGGEPAAAPRPPTAAIAHVTAADVAACFAGLPPPPYVPPYLSGIVNMTNGRLVHRTRLNPSFLLVHNQRLIRAEADRLARGGRSPPPQPHSSYGSGALPPGTAPPSVVGGGLRRRGSAVVALIPFSLGEEPPGVCVEGGRTAHQPHANMEGGSDKEGGVSFSLGIGLGRGSAGVGLHEEPPRALEADVTMSTPNQQRPPFSGGDESFSPASPPLAGMRHRTQTQPPQPPQQSPGRATAVAAGTPLCPPLWAASASTDVDPFAEDAALADEDEEAEDIRRAIAYLAGGGRRGSFVSLPPSPSSPRLSTAAAMGRSASSGGGGGECMRTNSTTNRRGGGGLKKAPPQTPTDALHAQILDGSAPVGGRALLHSTFFQQHRTVPFPSAVSPLLRSLNARLGLLGPWQVRFPDGPSGSAPGAPVGLSSPASAPSSPTVDRQGNPHPPSASVPASYVSQTNDCYTRLVSSAVYASVTSAQGDADGRLPSSVGLSAEALATPAARVAQLLLTASRLSDVADGARPSPPPSGDGGGAYGYDEAVRWAKYRRPQSTSPLSGGYVSHVSPLSDAEKVAARVEMAASRWRRALPPIIGRSSAPVNAAAAPSGTAAQHSVSPSLPLDGYGGGISIRNWSLMPTASDLVKNSTEGLFSVMVSRHGCMGGEGEGEGAGAAAGGDEGPENGSAQPLTAALLPYLAQLRRVLASEVFVRRVLSNVATNNAALYSLLTGVAATGAAAESAVTHAQRTAFASSIAELPPPMADLEALLGALRPLHPSPSHSFSFSSPSRGGGGAAPLVDAVGAFALRAASSPLPCVADVRARLLGLNVRIGAHQSPLSLSPTGKAAAAATEGALSCAGAEVFGRWWAHMAMALCGRVCLVTVESAPEGCERWRRAVRQYMSAIAASTRGGLHGNGNASGGGGIGRIGMLARVPTDPHARQRLNDAADDGGPSNGFLLVPSLAPTPPRPQFTLATPRPPPSTRRGVGVGGGVAPPSPAAAKAPPFCDADAAARGNRLGEMVASVLASKEVADAAKRQLRYGGGGMPKATIALRGLEALSAPRPAEEHSPAD